MVGNISVPGSGGGAPDTSKYVIGEEDPNLPNAVVIDTGTDDTLFMKSDGNHRIVMAAVGGGSGVPTPPYDHMQLTRGSDSTVEWQFGAESGHLHITTDTTLTVDSPSRISVDPSAGAITITLPAKDDVNLSNKKFVITAARNSAIDYGALPHLITVQTQSSMGLSDGTNINVLLPITSLTINDWNESLTLNYRVYTEVEQ